MLAPKYTYLRQGAPEILVDFSNPIVLDENNKFSSKEELTEYLEKEYIKMLDKQEEIISDGKIEEYEIFYKKSAIKFCRA